MAISYTLAPIPKWVIMNNAGTAAGGAKLYTYSSLNYPQQKSVYEDAAGTIPWPNPIIFDANGTQGPFYWKYDSATPTDLYYLEAYDSNDNFLWSIEDYSPPSSGGGGSATTYVPLNNYIANNVFNDHVDNTASPINATNVLIAPSNHVGFTPAEANPLSTATAGTLGPDIRFVKNNTGATDQISFVTFAMADTFSTSDVIPIEYVRYQCTVATTGETYKCFQFPICQKVKNLAGQPMSFLIWAKCGGGTETLQLYVRQYFGSGGSPSAENRYLVPTTTELNLTTTWTQKRVTFTVPSVAAATLGDCNDDAMYLQLEMPLNETCDIWFTKPKLYLGTIDPTQEFFDYDQINSVVNAPRTGQVMASYLSSAPRGWVAMNDGSIGNTGTLATTRANKDTFQLFATLYTTVSDTYAPVSGGRTAPGNTVQAAITDFVAGKLMTLPRSLGRAMAAAGSGSGLTARTLGQYLGNETHTLTIAEMPLHNHGSPLSIVGGVVAGAGNNFCATAGTGNPLGITIPDQGGGNAFDIMNPTSYMNFYIKL